MSMAAAHTAHTRAQFAKKKYGQKKTVREDRTYRERTDALFGRTQGSSDKTTVQPAYYFFRLMVHSVTRYGPYYVIKLTD